MANDTVYQIVTDQVMSALREGTVPWHQPWADRNHLPRSISTGKPYRGMNLFILGMSGHASPYWGTYKAITEHGGQVRKGERGTLVTFWKMLKKKNAPEDDKGFPMLRYYKVFSADQADWREGEDRWWPKDDGAPVAPIDDAERVFVDYIARGPNLVTGGDRACYSPALDEVRLPARDAFDGPEVYYSTAFHECGHSTGHESRLARRDLLSFHYFGDENYSREELVAEMTAAMVCGVVGIEQTVTMPQSAAYIDHWLGVLRGEPKLVIQAAAQAQKAADMILGPTDEEEGG